MARNPHRATRRAAVSVYACATTSRARTAGPTAASSSSARHIPNPTASCRSQPSTAGSPQPKSDQSCRPTSIRSIRTAPTPTVFQPRAFPDRTCFWRRNPPRPRQRERPATTQRDGRNEVLHFAQKGRVTGALYTAYQEALDDTGARTANLKLPPQTGGTHTVKSRARTSPHAMTFQRAGRRARMSDS